MVLCLNEEKNRITVILCQNRAFGFTLRSLAWMKPSPGRVVLLVHRSSKFTVNLISLQSTHHSFTGVLSYTCAGTWLFLKLGCCRQVNIPGALSSLTLSYVSLDTIYAALNTVVMAKSHMAKPFGNL